MRFVLLILLICNSCVLYSQKSRIVIHVAGNQLWMSPYKDTSITNFKLQAPGKYFKISGETYINSKSFRHIDLALSFNKGVTDRGIVKTSRLNYNLGFGRDYGILKLQFSPGFCYASMAYQDNVTGVTIGESRFSIALSFQADLALINNERNYLALFIEPSFMVHKPDKWVHQLGFGIAWKPVIFKPEEKIAPDFKL